jgi:hypothetical protein
MSGQPELHWPPGFARNLATFIYESSYVPIKEVSIAATLALLAGVCGRGFRTPTGKDLSLYLILVAGTGIGKDAIHEGIPTLIELSGIHEARNFVQAQDFVSGPALHKALLIQPGFLNLQGEFGRKLRQMANPLNSPMQALRTTMTDAYSKKRLSGRSYSDQTKSIEGVDWPALSFLGETTPGTFYDVLTPEMMEDGFLSRFLVISYDGPRPPPNRAQSFALEPDELDRWKMLLTRALPYQRLINLPPPIFVGYGDGPVSSDMLEGFEKECTDSLNASADDGIRQLWNRAHLKALKIASLLAVADNWVHPEIEAMHARWAIDLVRRDIAVFAKRQTSGDIGNDDHTRERKLLAVIEKYLTTCPVPPGYRMPDEMRQHGIVSRKYLQQNVSSASAFRSHRLGASHALDLTLRSLVDSGHLTEVDKGKQVEQYKFFGKCYRVLDVGRS